MRQVGHLLKLYQYARSAKHQNQFLVDYPKAGENNRRVRTDVRAPISFVMSVCPSVHMYQLGSHWTDLRVIWLWWKSVEKFWTWLMSGKTIGHFTWTLQVLFIVSERNSVRLLGETRRYKHYRNAHNMTLHVHCLSSLIQSFSLPHSAIHSCWSKDI